MSDDEPEADPENEAVEQERGPVYPFYHVSGDLIDGTTVQAGYVTETGEIDYLVMDMTDVGVNRVEQAFALAFGWYVDRLNEQAQLAAVATEAEADDGDEEEEREASA